MSVSTAKPRFTLFEATEERHKTFKQILDEAAGKALRGGIPGAAAMGIQVVALMWLRTTMNYQYRHGTSTITALKTLYSQGGIVRFYRGLLPALIQGPVSRFGDTAANAGVLSLLNQMEATRDIPVVAKTLVASGAAAGFRIALMPIDACKTIMQVEGVQGLPILGKKLKAGGPRVLFHGALAAAGATYVGHFPWFSTHNYLDKNLPRYEGTFANLGRNALSGFCASVVSDTCSNSIRVVKTYKQTHADSSITYPNAVKGVLERDGWLGLFGRGLKTRILANGMQGMLFSVLWKGLEKQFFGSNQRT